MKIFKTQSVKLLIISALCALAATLSYAQGVPHDRVIQDFTRANRLTGTPSANLSNTVIPNQDSPAGTLCGAVDQWNTSLTRGVMCLGHNPNVSCPAGYHFAIAASSGSDQLRTCIKD